MLTHVEKALDEHGIKPRIEKSKHTKCLDDHTCITQALLQQTQVPPGYPHNFQFLLTKRQQQKTQEKHKAFITIPFFSW